MPWIQVPQSTGRDIWLRTESIIGIAPAERHGSGTKVLLLSGATLDVAEEQEALLGKIRELEGTAARERRVGFPTE
ncbi:MAG: hypothetical protein QOF89_3239 [Acidobacteriota bacterium]|jgi:hypothetical protein|nr:hypothetical protein [Acidobacteriota bacterium]